MLKYACYVYDGRPCVFCILSKLKMNIRCANGVSGKESIMLEALSGGERVVGTKQVLKGIATGAFRCVYIAEDADSFLQEKITSACEKAGVQLITVPTMKALGEACRIDVGAACAALPAK